MTHREFNANRFHKENPMNRIIRNTVRGVAIVAALALTAPAAQADLIGFWEFDNAANVGEGTVGIDLTAQNGAAHTAAGQSGGGLALDGADDYLDGAPTVPLGDSSYTVSAWINTTTGGNRGIVGFGNYGSAGQVNATRLDGTTDLVNYSWGGPNDIQRNSGITLTNGAWHHVAAVYDSVASTKTLYVNGAQIGSAMGVPNLSVGSANFRIGSTNFGEFFNGTLDDVAIFDEALSQTVVQSIANGASATDTALVGLWRFDNTNQLGRDDSVHQNHTTAQGDTAYSAAGKYGGAASLDGAGDFFDRAAGIDRLPIGDSAYTIAAWIDADTTGARGIVGYGDYGSNSEVNALRIHEDNRLRHYWWADDLDSADVSAQSVDLDADGWVHVAVTYDGTTRTIWLNGVAITSDTPGAHNAADTNFRIGSTNFGEFFDGLLDDVAIFNIALGQNELQTIMSGDFTAFGVPAPAALPAGLALLGVIGLRRRRVAK